MNIVKSTSLALVAILISTSLASAGGFHLPGVGGSDSDSDSSGDLFHDAMPDNDPPDFGGVFNPQPQPEIVLNSDLVDTLNDDPRIQFTDLGIGQGGAKPGKAVKLNAKVKLGAILKCTVAGTPSEFPDDLRIANAGVVAIPAGTQLKWKVQGDSGIASLGQALQPGKTLKLNGVLPGGIEAGTACSAKTIGL